MKKVISIVGATASGKTGLSLQLAKDFNGEIISGDSIQAYKGFNIGSGKIMPVQMGNIKHYLIDILDYNQSYDIATFQSLARDCIDNISNNNHLPIMVGGSGLYVKSCLYDYDFVVNKPLDDVLVNVIENSSNQQLYDWLYKLDSKTAESIHVNNRVRLIRALTICLTNNENKSSIEAKQQHKPIYDVYMICLTWPREIIHQRISDRVDNMIKDGLVDEVKQLLVNGASENKGGMRGIGYKELIPYIKGEQSLEECITKIKTHSNQFAKRQETFFKHQFNDIHFYDMSLVKYEDIKTDINNWLNL